MTCPALRRALAGAFALTATLTSPATAPLAAQTTSARSIAGRRPVAPIVANTVPAMPDGMLATLHADAPAPAVVSAALTEWAATSAPHGRIQVLSPVLGKRIEALRRGSRQFDEAWTQLERSGVPTVILTDDQAGTILDAGWQQDKTWVGLFAAEPQTTLPEPIQRFYVVVRLDAAARSGYYNDHDITLNLDAPWVPWLDETLAHEIYGHLIPVLQQGVVYPSCEDADARTPKADRGGSCVERRTTRVREEVLAPTRTVFYRRSR